jgi:transposase
MLTTSRAWLVLEPVDMRLGINGLSLCIQRTLGRSPCDGSTYLFRNRAGTRLKLLQWAGNGVWLAQRRLHRGRFLWPWGGDSVFDVTHKRLKFGVKSEALAAVQRDLFQESQAIDQAAIEAELEQVEQTLSATPKPRRPSAGRQPLPAHLPRIEHRHEPATCTCADCGGALKLIREDVSEQLDVEPARIFIHRHIRR